MVHDTQEIEKTLQSIDSYKEVPLNEPVQPVERNDIPVVHSPGNFQFHIHAADTV